MSVKTTLNAQNLNMRCQDIIKVLVISDVSLISAVREESGSITNDLICIIKGRVVVTMRPE